MGTQTENRGEQRRGYISFIEGKKRMAKQSLKLRGFVVDKQTGKPVSNVVLLFEAKTDDDNATEPKSSKNKKKTSIESRTDINSIVVSSPLGMLVSDNAGYVSLDLSQYTNDKLPHSIQITPIGDEMCKSNVNALFVNQPDLKIHFVLKVNSNYVNCKTNVGLPSIQNPDDIDREVSPHSFTVKNELMLGEGNCQVPIPTPFEQRDFRFGRVVLKASQNLDDNLQSLDQKLLTVSELNPAMDLGQQENDLPLRVAEVLEFRQRWYPVGHSLGQIAYSLPLAPCESVNLAMIDWSRQDTIRRDDQVNSRETLLHDQRRDRTIEETLEAALSESQDGFSLLGGLGVGASATVPIETIPINISAMLSAGGGITHSSGNRDINADSLQELHDRVRQATSVVRSLNSTVIVQATQQEQKVVQTRTVTNHNHCHALTVQYYEVLQTFRVVTEFETRRRVLLIPYKLMKFDREAILRFRSILDMVLLKPSLSSCFDAVERLANCSSLYEETSASTDGTDSKPCPTPAPEAKDISSYTLTLETGERETWGAVWVKLVLKDGNEKLLRLKESVKGVFVEPEERELVLTRNSKRQWLITEGEAIGINHDDIGKVKVEWAEANWNDAWAFKGIGINYKLSGADLEHSLLINGLGYHSQHPYIEVDRPNNTKGFFDVPDNSPAGSGSRHLIWEAAVTLPQRDESSPSQLETPEKTPKERPVKATDECCENRLIAHLNGNIGYYNRAIWLLQDPVERRVLLEGLLAATGLADLVDETPVAVSGRYVAFPFDDPRLESVLLQSAVQEALSRLRLSQEVLNDIWNRAVESQPQEPAKPDPLVTYVSLPTRGLFAEAQLGHCNSCEVRDVTRFWKWDESPCEKAPAIEGVSPGPKGQAPTIPEPASLPNPVVQVMQAAAAPDPVGLAAALNLLGQPNIFRDMSGLSEVSGLLEKLASGTVTSMGEARNLAQKAQDKLNEATTKGTGGVNGAPSEQDAGKQIDKLNAIKYGLDEGLIDERQAADAATGVLGGTAIASSDSGFVPEGGTPILNITTNIVSFTSQDSLLSDGTVGPALLKFTAQILRPDGSPVEAPLHWRVEGNGVWSGGGGVGASLVGGSFSFNPTGAPTSNYGLGRGAREDLMSYIITASTIVDGVTIRDALIIQQNEVDQLRQEYIDYGLTVPDRGSFGAVPNNDTNFLAGNINGTVRRTNRGATRDEYGFILNGANMRTIGQQIGAEYSNLVAAATGQPGPFHVRVSSGYRNPLRNEEVGGCFSRGVPVPVCQGPSRHMMGEALDLVPGEVVPGESMADLMDILNTAVSNVGLNPLPESGTVPVGNPRIADHIHVQF